MKKISLLLAALAILTAPALAQGTLLPTKPPVPEYPPEAASLGISGCCKTLVIAGEDGKVAEAYALCNDPLFEPAARSAVRRMRFAPQTGEGGPTRGARYQRDIRFSADGAPAAQCPAPEALLAKVNGTAGDQMASTSPPSPPPMLDFYGSCGTRPALSPSSVSGVTSLDRTRINPAGEQWQRFSDWSKCRATRYETVAAQVRAHWGGRVIQPGSEDERQYLATVDRLLAEADTVKNDRALSGEYVKALNARADALEAEDRAKSSTRAPRRYDRPSSGGMTAAEAYYDSLSAAPHLRCLEDAYTEQQRMRCMDTWLGVQMPQ
ncbi:energy transducer TonB [Hyphomonas sp. WL0036]|uniref:energy transducer TonB n=1 Tax=Hyphomonas sediminis TaxID=2866160 RepID=UPI001C8077B8|nr:energy transducer TonB [Hyphomonas sediminis]MBY9066683.1 energy transducer TonB [Hyphomonas sediminis]